MQDWMIEMVKRMLKHLPIGMLTRMGLATFVAPRTSNWSGAAGAIQEYIDEQHADAGKGFKPVRVDRRRAERRGSLRNYLK